MSDEVVEKRKPGRPKKSESVGMVEDKMDSVEVSKTTQQVQEVPTSLDRPDVLAEEREQETEQPKRDTVVVDALLWHKMLASLVRGNWRPYTQVPAVRMFGQMRGAKTYAEENAFWQETQKYLQEHK